MIRGRLRSKDGLSAAMRVALRARLGTKRILLAFYRSCARGEFVFDPAGVDLVASVTPTPTPQGNLLRVGSTQRYATLTTALAMAERSLEILPAMLKRLTTFW